MIGSVADAIRVIRGTDYDARAEAERFLATRRPAEVVGSLADGDWKVRMFAARALARMPAPDPEIAAAVSARLKVEDDDWVANNLRSALRQHGRPAPNPPLQRPG
jgi:hypothetical protein